MSKELWTPPENYYQDIASSEVNSTLHWAARKIVGGYVNVRFGKPIVLATDELQEADFSEGNVMMALGHRHFLDTITFPGAIEKVGIHHARPISKIELFQTPVSRWFFHGCGAFAVDRSAADLDGLAEAQNGILRNGGSGSNYAEGTRVVNDVRSVRTLKSGLVVTAALNGSTIVPGAVAGLSVEKSNPENIRRDKRSWLGIGPRLVFAFGDPMTVELPYPEANFRNLDKNQRNEQKEAIRYESERVRRAMQGVLDWSYDVRGSSLEVSD